MILVRPGFDIQVEESKLDKEGRFIYMKIHSQDNEFKLLNIYAPNREIDQVIFWQKC